MLKSEPMQKVRIICLKGARYPVVAGLHRLGMMDLRKSELALGDDIPSEGYTRLSDMLIRVQGALDILGKRAMPEKQGKLLGNRGTEARFGELEGKVKEVYALRDGLESISEDNRALDNAEAVAKCFGSLKVNLGSLSSGVLSFMAVVVGDKELAGLMEHSRKTAGKNAEIFTNRIAKGRNLVFAAYKKGEEGIEEALKGLRGEELDLHARYVDSTPQAIIKSVTAKRAVNAAEAEKAKRKLEGIAAGDYSAFMVLKESLSVELERAGVSSAFKRTESTFAMEGWVPRKRLGELRAFVHKATGNRFVLEELKTSELAPTLVNRPGFLKPFDYLMEFFSLPRSDEIDPTWIFIISFPIFYGIMISDVGYGIMSLILSQLIIMKVDPDGLMGNAARVWRISAVPAMIVGVLTNQWLGLPLNSLFTAWHGVDWFSSITSIIALTVIFGIIQVSLGLVLGAINEVHHGHRKLAVSKITSIILIVAGTIAVSGGFFHVFPSALTMDAAYVSIAMLVATVALSGIEATEMTNLITHTLSYSRIMGFGLGSIILAMLIDQAFTPHLSSGIVLFVVYGAVFLTFHVLNMIVSIFEGMVQSARLNFVEFFSKFYKGGGIKYRPFSYRRVYTEE